VNDDDPVKKSPFGKSFTNKLRKLGFASYDDYLASEHWQKKRAEYFASGLPEDCIGCGRTRSERPITLHHRTYTRLGCEQLLDLIPLCMECHGRVHEYERTHKTNINGTHKILRMLFKWSKDEMRRRFAPFMKNEFMGWVDREELEKPKPSQMRKRNPAQPLDS
jgi:hypothetical protein